jgi:CheY-like chemotaxis protein
LNAPRKLAFVVEDDPESRRILRKYLEHLSFDVVEAATGKSALSLLEQRIRPALVCLDLILPELSGYEICEKIRASPRLATVPVLVVSARSMPPDRALAEELGANAYLVKPIRWKTFSQAVAELLPC